MMQAISNFFQWIAEIISSLLQFVYSLITGLFSVIKALPHTLNMATTAIGYLPPAIAVFATLCITVSIVYIIVGRESGG